MKKFYLKPIPAAKKWPIFLATFFAYCSLYLITNRIHLGAPVQLFSLWIDQVVPFMSFTVWVYLTHLFFVISVVYFFNDDIIFSRFFYALNIGSLLSIVIFFFYPTTIERKTHVFSFVNEMVFWFVYALDNPVNCFPSLHVFWVMIGLIPLFYKKPNGFIWIFLWGILIIFSTMTTKQHYSVDVLGGTLLAFLSWRFTKLLF